MRLSPTWKSAGVDGLQLLDVGLIDMADLDIEDVFTLREASHNVIASSVLPDLMHKTQNPYPVTQLTQSHPQSFSRRIYTVKRVV